ncbi:hypothetical protein BDF20DRAFT_908426 [Mycotypha africana]|uniref:uncharacterized protein n=1 Tax=Mycotypha africana TaxID=64632 RepID=UPI002300A10E|nr:uncharacterized protein BDF20DRAFT_908426 [Mycotypha africana]KAI8967361.1 hypothetical protein BDF20DRAFT_908426 [Mycotypha africana]
MAIDIPTANELYCLLGSAPSSIDFKALLSTTDDVKPTISKLADYVYYAFKPLGISFCFTYKERTEAEALKPGATPSNSTSSNNAMDNLILDAIDIYNGETPDGFLPFQQNILLPCGITSSMHAYEIVQALGEPDRKGGGGRTRMPCWIEYKFNNTNKKKDSGLMIQLHGVEWEDREMGWSSIVLY